MKPFLIFISLILLSSCKNTKRETITNIDEGGVEVALQDPTMHPGKRFMEAECYLCHDPKASRTRMIAPPMAAIKLYYIDSNTTKASFTADLIRWVNDPQTTSKMPGALKRFGCMPYMPHPDTALVQIAAYLYDYEVEQPYWFDADKAAKRGTGVPKGNGMGKRFQNASRQTEAWYTQVTLAHIRAAQEVLAQNLQTAVQEGGPTGAIGFCHEKALVLTDSISDMRNVRISRVTDRPRNSKNQANEYEMALLTSFGKSLASGEEPVAKVLRENGEVRGYYPILTNAMCMQCHGKPREEVSAETRSMLQSLYPNDQAIGYDINQLRGLWRVVFEEYE